MKKQFYLVLVWLMTCTINSFALTSPYCTTISPFLWERCIEKMSASNSNVNLALGRDTLRLVRVQGDTAVRQGGQVRLTITMRNTGTAASDPNTPLSIFQQQQPFAFKGPQPLCFQIVSNSVAIGRSIQPNETITQSYFFTINDDFTHISPLEPFVTYSSTVAVTIGNRGNSYCNFVFVGGGVVDTLAYRFDIKALLDNADLAAEIIATDTTYGFDGIYNFAIKITNKGTVGVKNVKTNISPSPNSFNQSTFSAQKGQFVSIFFFGTYYNIWTVSELAAGESVMAQVQVKDSLVAAHLSTIVVTAHTASNQIFDNDNANNRVNKTFTRRVLVLPDLAISALPTSVTEANAGNLTEYPFATALKLKYRYTISNATTAQADSFLYFDVYISRDSAISDDDYRRFRVGSPMGANRTGESDIFVLPTRGVLPNGKYYVFIKIDGTNAFNESDENNNVSAGIPYVYYGLNCDGAAQIPWGNWISNVKFSSLDNTSGQILKNNGQFTAGYSGFTTVTTSVERGKTYPLSITSSSSWSGRFPNHRYTAWLDYNGDGDFDDIGEKIYQNTGINGVSSGNITIPNSAVLGKTILRVAVRNGDYAETCTTYSEGEVEDYYIDIKPEELQNNIADLALNMSATPSVFTKYTNLNMLFSAKNVGNQAFTNVKIEFKFPQGTVNGGAATASVGKWEEWCAGNIRCFTWTIPTLNANQTATLGVPLFVLDVNGSIVATSKLLSSSPIDGNALNNQASVTILPAATESGAALFRGNSATPQGISPTITESSITLNFESLIEKEVSFEIYNSVGILVQKDVRYMLKGANQMTLDVHELSKGFYLLVPNQSSFGQNRVFKFIKI